MPHCRVQSHGKISHDRATLQGVRIPSAILKIVFRHILFFWFLNAVWALTSGSFCIASDTLIIIIIIIIIRGHFEEESFQAINSNCMNNHTHTTKRNKLTEKYTEKLTVTQT